MSSNLDKDKQKEEEEKRKRKEKKESQKRTEEENLKKINLQQSEKIRKTRKTKICSNDGNHNERLEEMWK